MPLQSSGAISLSNIASEMGGSTPHSLSEYYKGGGLVGNHANNPNVPTSGTISFSNFYGANNTSPVVANTATMTAGTYAVPNDKYGQTLTGYNSSGIIANYGSASDNTMDDSSGNSITVKTLARSYNTIAIFGHFRCDGNFSGQTFSSAFGYTGVKWGGTKVLAEISAQTGSYDSSRNLTFWLMSLSATPTGTNQTVEFTN